MNVMTMIFLLIVMAIMMATMKTWPGWLTRQCAWGGLVIQQ